MVSFGVKTSQANIDYADIWHCSLRGVDEFRHKSRVLDEHCAAIGRDPAEITRSVQVLIRPDDDASAVRDGLSELVAAGVGHVVLGPVPPMRSVRWLADEIAEPLVH